MAKILIVDDNRESRELLKKLALHRGHEVREASDGAEALDLAWADVPAVVVTDLLMPTMDSYELVRKLRERPETSATPVVFCTAHYLGREARALAKQCGVRIVLTKPVEPEDFLQAVEEALGEERADVPSGPSDEGAIAREHQRLLTDELSATTDELRAANEKLSSLLELSLSMSSERDPDRLLHGFCRAARSLTGARYAGAAAWNRANAPAVEYWCALGLPEEKRVSLRVPATLPGLDALAKAGAERFSGRSSRGLAALPEGHPPVDSLLLAPVLAMERLYGWVYLGDKIGLADFTESDEELVATLARQLGRIHENGKLYNEVERNARKLAERERQLSALFEGVMDAMIIADDEGRYLAANPAAAELFGVSRDELLGRRAWDFSKDEERERERWKRFLEDGQMSGTFRLERPDGEPRELDFRATANFLPGRHLSILRDVTEQRRLEDNLRHTAKMEAIGRLAGGIAHDFNNLLTVINGYAELVAKSMSPEDPSADFVEEIQTAGERSAALTHQLLAFSRRQVLSPAVVDLNDVVRNMERLLERIIGEDVRLKSALSPELGRCKVDPGQIEQVLMNLAVNSRDAMPGGGRLLIQTGNVEVDADSAELHGVEPGSYVTLVVSDDGQGMDRETLSRLFEPFFTTKARGTGLGLATVYGIVKQSGGHVNVYSEPGSGTTFRIYLPRVSEAPTAKRVAKAADERGTETLLLVEDDDAVRRLAARILTRLGYTVLEAEGVGDALSRIEGHEGPLDLLVTDVVMPDGSGRLLAEEVRARHPGVKLLFMSGYTDDGLPERDDLEKDVVFLQKPFTSASLSRKVREALGD